MLGDGDFVAVGGLKGGLWRKGFSEKEFSSVAMFMEGALDGVEEVFLSERFEEGVGAMDEMGEIVASGYYLQFGGNEEAISHVSGQKEASNAEANDDLEQG